MPLNLKTLLIILLPVIASLSSCQRYEATTKTSKIDENGVNITSKMTIKDVFSCKPAKKPFIGAHRASQKSSELPENNLSGLKDLHENGILFAEIDISRLRDSIHILFHDGVWDKKTVRKGIVAKTNWKTAQKYLLRNTDGSISSQTPSTLAEILQWSYGKMILSIDLKSSADPTHVIELIKKYKMQESVFLISYTRKQALSLHKLSPISHISYSIKKRGDLRALSIEGINPQKIAAWKPSLSTNQGQSLNQYLKSKDIIRMTPSFPKIDAQYKKTGNANHYKSLSKHYDLIITDYYQNAQKAIGWNKSEKQKFKQCLENRQ